MVAIVGFPFPVFFTLAYQVEIDNAFCRNLCKVTKKIYGIAFAGWTAYHGNRDIVHGHGKI